MAFLSRFFKGEGPDFALKGPEAVIGSNQWGTRGETSFALPLVIPAVHHAPSPPIGRAAEPLLFLFRRAGGKMAAPMWARRLLWGVRGERRHKAGRGGGGG